MHTHKTYKKQPDTNQAASQKQSAANKGPATQLKADTLGLPTGLKAGVEHLRSNTATAEAPIQPMRQEMPHKPWHVMQQGQLPRSAPLSAEQQPVQRVTNATLQVLDKNAQQMWELAYPKMEQVANASPFGQSDKHSVVLWAVPGDMEGMENTMGVTYLYMSKDDNSKGYQPGDHKNFTQVLPPIDFSTKSARAYRIVVVLNLTDNDTPEELFTTFLHEWYVHALPWIKDVTSKNKVVKDTTTKNRIGNEHKAYANTDDETLKGYVASLNLDKGDDQVFSKLKNDRNRYNKKNGNFKMN